MREFDGAQHCQFVPGMGAKEHTRPYFFPHANENVPKRLIEITKLMAAIYYPGRVTPSSKSYGIHKESKVGIPYNKKGTDVIMDMLRELTAGKLTTKYAGQFVTGTRIQTDSSKIRMTGAYQTKPLGDGFFVQRHRAIEAMAACGHILAIYEFDYHHHFLSSYGKTVNVDVDKVEEANVYAVSWDNKHWERSPIFKHMFQSMVSRLREIGRPNHADILERMNLNITAHYRPLWRSKDDFSYYVSCVTDVDKYGEYTLKNYGFRFEPDEHVKALVEEASKDVSTLTKSFEIEQNAPRSWLPGYITYDDHSGRNSSGSPTTATAGKLAAISDTLYRLEIIYNIKWSLSQIASFLKHEFPLRLMNLSDDNVLMNTTAIPNKFFEIETGTTIERVEPGEYLGRLFSNPDKPQFYKLFHLIPRPHAWFRKLSRERSIESYLKPALGWFDSLTQALKNEQFKKVYPDICAIYEQTFMPISEFVEILKTADKPTPGLSIDAIRFLDNPGDLYKRSGGVTGVELAPELFFAITPVMRDSIIKNYGI